MSKTGKILPFQNSVFKSHVILTSYVSHYTRFFFTHFTYMDNKCKIILNKCGIIFENEIEINGILIPREVFMNNEKYKELKSDIEGLKELLSSSSLTALQKNADKRQKWPLLNLVRQILSSYKYDMKPIRKSDGYTPDGIKKYKRFFQVVKE